MPILQRKAILLFELLTAAVCVYLCWHAVSWALQPGLSMMLDEIGNLHMRQGELSFQFVTILPHYAYNDRPAGLVVERSWFELFGFNYRPQLLFLLSIHLANLVLGFLLSRRAGAGVLASLAALCAFGTLSTTAQAATYLGAIFDVLGLFFILASILAFLSKKPGTAALSALLFFLALRTKEFAIVLPVLLLAIAYFENTLRRLWIHLAIWAVFLMQYAGLLRHMNATLPPGSVYTIRADIPTVLASFSYYTSLIFHEEWRPSRVYFVLALVAMVLLYAVYRRRGWILWSSAAYVLTLLPVTVIPGNRAPYYVYAPALFLALALALTVEDVLALVIRDERTRWVATAAAVVAVLLSVALFQRGPYFKNRVGFTLLQRRTAQVTAASITALLPGLRPDSWLYVYHGANRPWLLLPGPCDYLNLPLRRQAYNCVLSDSLGS